MGIPTTWAIITLLSTAAASYADSNILPPLTDGDVPGTHGAQQNTLFIREYSISGNTVLPKKVIEKAVRPYIERYLHRNDLTRLQDTLTALYVQRGYITSGARINNQTLKANRLHIDVTEGTLDTITIVNPGRLKKTYIENRLNYEMDNTVNLENIEEQLQLLKQNPRIKTLHSELAPSETLGKANLKVIIEEQLPYYIDVEVNNHETPSVGAEQLNLTFHHMNITGYGDSLDVGLQKTAGKDTYSLQYQWPLLANGATVGLSLNKTDTTIIEEPFDALNINSEYSSISIDSYYPLHQTVNNSFGISAAIGHHKSQSFLLGSIPISFTDNVEDGQARVSTLRLGQHWATRKQRFALLLDSTISIGLSAFDATNNEPAGIDDQFIKWSGQLQVGQRLTWLNSQLLFNARLQYTNTLLLGLEKFSIGGANSVRGYRVGSFLGDLGAVASLEWRVPLYQHDAHIIQLAPFIDTGYVRQKNTALSNETLASAGIGLRWEFLDQAHAELYYAHGFDDNDLDSDLQDKGIHFRTGYQF